jgi:hypothetical protein
MFKVLFGKREENRESEEQALELARTTLMNRVTQVIERSTTMQLRFADVSGVRPLHH